ncbi:major tail protein [Gordonia phage Strosahl]|uniref:Major tail protein n=3 Tax=Soupsvirus TaxID=1982562 RepID=A0A1B3B181_9CAUD|nr:major tail protein [Gordonia phage Remus]YP_009596226.1 major tail protein [Gordonia phage Strosahl]YP_009624540.1 major tail protein [Gordonia phage Waits]AXH47823.1 major tail protein [Gordonia phage LastResort]QFP95090.1 major tail protein [Gordonia phage MinecraftSteve]QZD98674.1 major tail protein [Gordonia phage Looper]UAJ15516.1 major tail protein [Gordonia Phage Boohoo]UOK18078.1 major tail protein [Gordonia phage Switzerland]UVD39771.1 major tail protein [Gordonia phage Anaysia]
MSLNDNAVLTAAMGYVFTAPVGTAAPTPAQLGTLNLEDTSGWTGNTAWDSIGHTSRGEMPEFGFDGGDSEMKGSWQKKKLREITAEDPIDYLTLRLHQFDETAFNFYYGENASSTPGVFGVSTKGNKRAEKAFLVVIVDGDERVGFHVSKASVKRDDAIQLPTDDLASLPIRATFLDHVGSPLLFSWINEDLFNTETEIP